MGNCPPSKLITNIHFRPSFVQNWLTPNWKQHSSTLQNRQYSRAFQKLVNIKVSLTFSCVEANDSFAFKERHFSMFTGKTHYLGFGRFKLEATHPVNYFPIFFGKNDMLRTAHPVNCSYFTLPDKLRDPVGLWRNSTWIRNITRCRHQA